MGQYFWIYKSDLPAELSVETFSATHLAWVAAGLALSLLIVSVFVKSDTVRRQRIEWSLGILLGASYLLRWGWALAIGHFDPAEMLPLHLSPLTAMIEIAAVFSRKPLLKEFGYACGLPGGIAAILLPGTIQYPFWHVYHLIFAVTHILMALLPVLWIAGRSIRPSLRRLPWVFGILAVAAGFNVFVNQALPANFMFLRYVKEDYILYPLVEWLGNPGYQFAMVLGVFAVWIVIYMPWILLTKRQRKAKMMP